MDIIPALPTRAGPAPSTEDELESRTFRHWSDMVFVANAARGESDDELTRTRCIEERNGDACIAPVTLGWMSSGRQQSYQHVNLV